MTTREDFERLADELHSLWFGDNDEHHRDPADTITDVIAALRLSARQDQSCNCQPHEFCEVCTPCGWKAQLQTSQEQDMADRMEETTRQPASASSPAPVEAPTREEVEEWAAWEERMHAHHSASMLRRLWAALERERARSYKFMWQVRDTCARAEAAERVLSLTRTTLAGSDYASLPNDFPVDGMAAERMKDLLNASKEKEAAEQRVRELELDAERYRWLVRTGALLTARRDFDGFYQISPLGQSLGDEVSKVIDAARAEAKGEGHETALAQMKEGKDA